jgi:flagellar basal body-associated protein FliL
MTQKDKDITLILVIVFISAVVAFLVSNWLFGSEQQREQKAEVVDVITPEFRRPPEKYFNTQSLNPTKLIEIGDNPNPNPFGNEQ